MSKVPIFKVSTVILLIVAAIAVFFPIGILFIFLTGPTALYILVIPFLIVVCGLVYRGFKGLAATPNGRVFKIIRIGAYIAPVIGIISGIIAYLDNDGQLGYLFWYPLCVTLGLITILGFTAKLLSKRYIKKFAEKQKTAVFAPQQPLPATAVIPTITKTIEPAPLTETKNGEGTSKDQPTDFAYKTLEPISLPDQQPQKSTSFIRIVIIAVISLIVIVITAIIANRINNSLHKDNLRQTYQAALKRCGIMPIVVVESNGFFGDINYEAYSAKNKLYDYHLYLYNATYKTKGYFCTIGEARLNYNIDSLDNDTLY